MQPVILTGWTGDDWRPISDATVPLMRQYASLHGMRFATCDLAGERPASWMKLPAILAALREAECVVWIDADVVIEHGTADIMNDVPASCWQAMVEHVTPSGHVPNCGVWVVRRAMHDTLCQAWDGGRHVHHPWWEQAAVLELMGYRVDGASATLDTPTTLYERTAFLAAEWNDHPHDERRAEHVRFRHVTCYDNRLQSIRQFAARVTWTST